MSLFAPKKDSECLLVFDIGSGSVAGAIVLTSPTHPPTVLYHHRCDIPFQEEATGLRLLSLMLRALSQTVLAILHEGYASAGFGSHHPRIKEALVSLSAPWIVSKTSFLKLRSKEPIRITPEVFSSLLEESKQDPDRDIPKGSVEVEQKLIKSVLNGYETPSPYNKEASTAEFAVFGSFSVPRVTERVSDTISHLIHTKHISFHSFSLLAFATIRELYPNEDDFIVVDLSGEQTEIGIVKKGMLIETATFPFGKNHFIRIVQRHGQVPPAGVASFLKLYLESKGTGRLFERTQKLLGVAEGEWREQFSNTLRAVSEEVFLPKTLFLAADDDIVPVFDRAIREGDFSRFTLSPASFRTITLKNEMLNPLVTWGTSETPDPFIGIIAAFTNRIRA